MLSEIVLFYTDSGIQIMVKMMNRKPLDEGEMFLARLFSRTTRNINPGVIRSGPGFLATVSCLRIRIVVVSSFMCIIQMDISILYNFFCKFTCQ